MSVPRIRVLVWALIFVCATVVTGQDYPPISAANIANLQSRARIDFADFPGKLKIGWFEANADASEFIVFDQAGRIYRVSEAGIMDSWAYVAPGSGQLFSLIDAVYIDDEPQVLYVLDGVYFINEQRLHAGYEPISLASHGVSLFVEVIKADGHTIFLRYALRDEGEEWQLVDEFLLPVSDPEQPAVRIGRIAFPFVLYSSLLDGALKVFRYSNAFAAGMGREYSLTQGPAVFGAINGATGSHFAWSDPASTRLNLLDLATGENSVVAEIGGAYAQYHLLTADASAILIVNLDFAPGVYAWDVETGERHDLGAYRDCKRIPDKVALSADGRALIMAATRDWKSGEWRIERKASDGLTDNQDDIRLPPRHV